MRGTSLIGGRVYTKGVKTTSMFVRQGRQGGWQLKNRHAVLCTNRNRPHLCMGEHLIMTQVCVPRLQGVNSAKNVQRAPRER